MARYKSTLQKQSEILLGDRSSLASPLLGNGQKMRSSFVLVIARATVQNMQASATVASQPAT